MGRDFPDDDFIFYAPERCGIDRMRNDCLKFAREQNCDYLYFIDDDMILTPHTYKALREADKDIVMAHTIIRGYPFHVMSFIDPEDKEMTSDRELPATLDFFDEINDRIGLVRVDAIGCACTLFKMSIFGAGDYFLTSENSTEDVYCCLRLAQEKGRQNLQIFTHMDVPTGHIMDPEIVYAGNRVRLEQRATQDYGLQPKPISS